MLALLGGPAPPPRRSADNPAALPSRRDFLLGCHGLAVDQAGTRLEHPNSPHDQREASTPIDAVAVHTPLPATPARDLGGLAAPPPEGVALVHHARSATVSFTAANRRDKKIGLCEPPHNWGRRR